MSTYAQRVQLGPFFHNGEICGAATLEHYDAGTNTLRNIWSDRGMTTTLAQPFAADADGIFNFFADGLYKLVIRKSDGTELYTLDNWQVIDRTDPTFSEGAMITSASTIAVGPEVFAHIGGSTNIGTISGTIPFFWAVFDGTLTLLHSAALLCPGGVNLPVLPGEIYFFLNEGSGVWRVSNQRRVAVENARTNTIDAPLTVTSLTTGTPAAGIGTAILYQAESGDEAPSSFGQAGFAASAAGAGAEMTYFTTWLRVAGAALSEAYRWACTTAFKAIFTHANTADRTYTLPDVSMTVAGRNNTETLTSKTVSALSNTIQDPETDYVFFEDFVTVPSSTTGVATVVASNSSWSLTDVNSKIVAESNSVASFQSAVISQVLRAQLDQSVQFNTSRNPLVKMRIRVAVGGNNHRIGLSDGNLSADPTNGVFIRYSTGSNYFFVARSGGTETTLDSGVVANTTNWRAMRMVITGTTSVVCYVDGSSVGTISTNIPSVDMGFYVGTDTNGGVGRGVSVDYIYIAQARS